MPATITRIYTRWYRDSDQKMAYVDWSDGSRTEGKAYGRGDKPLLPTGTHMGALFGRAIASGLKVEHEVW